MKGHITINGILVDVEKIKNPKIRMILGKEGEDFWFRHKEHYLEHSDTHKREYNDHTAYIEHRDYQDYKEKYSDGSCEQ